MFAIAECMETHGYVFLPGYAPAEPGEIVARSLGSVLEFSPGNTIHELVPTTQGQSTPNTYSGNYGFAQFPFHTDFAHWRHPPRFVMLRCVVGFVDVPTLLVDGTQIIEQVGHSLLCRALVQPRRPVNGKIPLLRLLHVIDDALLIRWDGLFLRPASNVGQLGMAAVRSAIGASSSVAVALAQSGDTLILDNWRMLHSRSRVPVSRHTRMLERAYLERLH